MRSNNGSWWVMNELDIKWEISSAYMYILTKGDHDVDVYLRMIFPDRII